MRFENLYKKYENTRPLVNPITYQYNKNFKGELLGDAGKLYLRRGRMNDPIFANQSDVCYGVPAVWNRPFGFKYDGHSWWITKSELLAMRHYREHGNAQIKLKRKFDHIIKRQEAIYALSSAVDSNVELPILKEGFIPRPHQKVGIEFGNLVGGRFIIADQQRTGKSYTALLYVLSQEWSKCLIVAPAKVVPIWKDMIERICDLNVNILRSNGIMEGGFNIVSYDILHTIKNLRCDIAIADEAHFFVEADARRSKAVNTIIADKKLALTGTPIMNDASNMISILKWVNPEIAKELEPIIIAGKNELDSYEQALVLGEELKSRCLLLRETNQVSTGVEPYVNFIDLDTKIENPKDLQEIGRAKVNYAIEYCKAFQDKILVIFYYKETGKMLRARFGSKTIVIDGDSTEEEIKLAKESFANDIQILCASSVLAEGHDMSHCNNMLLLEEPNYSMRTDQIRERCSRVNKEEEVTIDILRIPNTQDDRVYELYRDKFDLQYGLRDA